jgi:hypothetical protein
MPLLSASTSVFQLAFGINAVLPIVMNDFEKVREELADMQLRKIKEYNSQFNIRERDWPEFVEFVFLSSRGMRFAQRITHLTALLSLVLCIVSLAFLCWSATAPDHLMSSQHFYWFVAATLVIAPILYYARDRGLKALYKLMVIHTENEQREAELLAGCAKLFFDIKKTDREIENKTLEAEVEAARIELRILYMRVKAKLDLAWLWLSTLWRRVVRKKAM